MLHSDSLAGRTTYSYDADGNQTRKETPVELTDYVWDETGKMTLAQPPAGDVSLTYNGLGQRVEKETPAEVRRFLYDFIRLQEEHDAADDPKREYAFGPDNYEENPAGFGDLISEYDYDEDETYAHTYDAQWNTEALLDDGETQQAKYKYRAFGLIHSEEGPAATKLNFVGKQGYYRDEELSLFMLGMGNNDGIGGGHLNPATGTFLRKDPARENLNDYDYANNNPINVIDPSGQKCINEEEVTRLVNDKVALLMPPEPENKYKRVLLYASLDADMVEVPTLEYQAYLNKRDQFRSLLYGEETAKCLNLKLKLALNDTGNQIRNGTFEYSCGWVFDPCYSLKEQKAKNPLWSLNHPRTVASQEVWERVQADRKREGKKPLQFWLPKKNLSAFDINHEELQGICDNTSLPLLPLITAQVSIEEFLAPTELELKQSVEKNLATIIDSESDWFGKFLDGVTIVLDVLGMIPILGKFFDIASGTISAVRGKFLDAALSSLALIEFFGQPVAVAKITKALAAFGGVALATAFSTLRKTQLDEWLGNLRKAFVFDKARPVSEIVQEAMEKLKKWISDNITWAKQSDETASTGSGAKAGGGSTGSTSGGKGSEGGVSGPAGPKPPTTEGPPTGPPPVKPPEEPPVAPPPKPEVCTVGPKVTDELIEAASRLGIKLDDITIADGVAKAKIDPIMQSFNRADMDLLRDFVGAKGAKQLVLNTGQVIKPSISRRIQRAIDRGEQFLGGTPRLLREVGKSLVPGDPPIRIFEIVFDVGCK